MMEGETQGEFCSVVLPARGQQRASSSNTTSAFNKSVVHTEGRENTSELADTQGNPDRDRVELKKKKGDG